MMCHAGFGGVDPRRGELLLLPRDVRRRLRRPRGERRTRRGADARPEHRERAGRGDGAELPGARGAPLARRGLRRRRAVPRRARAAQGLRLRPADDVHRARRPHGARPGGRASAATTGGRPSTCSCAAARSGASRRRRRSSSRPATRSATARAAAAATARRRSATRSSCVRDVLEGKVVGRARARGLRRHGRGGTRVAVIDPITFEVIRNALVAATDEMVLALKRSAYSTNIKTRSDFSCAFFDAELRSVAQGFAQPVHLGSMVEQVPKRVRRLRRREPRAGRHAAHERPVPERRAPERREPDRAGPREGELLGYVANLAHHVDVGGGAPASIGAFREVFQEGVIIPPVKLVSRRADRRRRLPARPRPDPLEARDGRRLPRPGRREQHRRAAACRRWSSATAARRSSPTMSELLAYTERRTPPSSPRSRTASTRPRASSTTTATPTSRCGLRRASTIGPDGVHFDIDRLRPAAPRAGQLDLRA